MKDGTYPRTDKTRGIIVGVSKRRIDPICKSLVCKKGLKTHTPDPKIIKQSWQSCIHLEKPYTLHPSNM